VTKVPRRRFVCSGRFELSVYGQYLIVTCFRCAAFYFRVVFELFVINQFSL